jgi:hypothetical protein
MISVFENNIEKEKISSDKFIQNLQNCGNIEQAKSMFEASNETEKSKQQQPSKEVKK